MLFIDKKFINLISSQLRNFKWKSAAVANFSCPICGDSSRKKTKTRGYLFPIKDSYCYKCHNCSASLSFSNFLKTKDNNLYTQYLFEKFKETGALTKREATPVNTDLLRNKDKPDVLKTDIVCVTALDMTHPCKKYLLQRRIPMKYHRYLYYTEDFAKWGKAHFPNCENLRTEPRLVIPFYKRDSDTVYAAQGRSLDPKNTMRYITLKQHENEVLIYGIDRVDFSKQVFVVEGPLDSLFIENTVAMATAGKDVPFCPQKTTYIYDNEPRNPQIKQYMKEAVDGGFSIVVWPKTIVVKDINDMILSGLTRDKLSDIISENTFSGLQAHIKIHEWSKS